MAHRLCDGPQPVGCLSGHCCDDGGFIGCSGDLDLVETGQTGFHRGKGFLHGFVERAADRHCFADRFHRGCQIRLGPGELLEGKTRNFRHDIVDGGFEGGRGDLGDVIVQLVQRIADRQFRSDLGDRETGCLGG